jgi:hypothetical protein
MMRASTLRELRRNLEGLEEETKVLARMLDASDTRQELARLRTQVRLAAGEIAQALSRASRAEVVREVSAVLLRNSHALGLEGLDGETDQDPVADGEYDASGESDDGDAAVTGGPRLVADLTPQQEADLREQVTVWELRALGTQIDDRVDAQAALGLVPALLNEIDQLRLRDAVRRWQTGAVREYGVWVPTDGSDDEDGDEVLDRSWDRDQAAAHLADYRGGLLVSRAIYHGPWTPEAGSAEGGEPQ